MPTTPKPPRKPPTQRVYQEDEMTAYKAMHAIKNFDDVNESLLEHLPKGYIFERFDDHVVMSKIERDGNCKQSVPVALAIFHETTSAAIDYYFEEKGDASGFLKLFNTWWMIANSKQRFNSGNRLGNAATANDNKPEFLRELANWVEKWDELKLPNCEKFTLSAQTSSALRRTLRCHAALIEDLLNDGYDFVLTARFQSDPLERRYGQYRQMSGGRFLVSLWNVECSEKILKIKSLLREGFDIDENVKVKEDYTNRLLEMGKHIELDIRDGNHLSLCATSRNLSNHVAGYVAVTVQYNLSSVGVARKDC
jgi:hypothetical protein